MLVTDIFGAFQCRWPSSEFSQCSQYHSFDSRILRAGALKFSASLDSRDSHQMKVSRLSVISRLKMSFHTLPGAVIAMACQERLHAACIKPSAFRVLQLFVHDFLATPVWRVTFVGVCKKKYTPVEKSLIYLKHIRKVQIAAQDQGSRVKDRKVRKFLENFGTIYQTKCRKRLYLYVFISVRVIPCSSANLILQTPSVAADIGADREDSFIVVHA